VDGVARATDPWQQICCMSMLNKRQVCLTTLKPQVSIN
jgi:hypothetical protein